MMNLSGTTLLTRIEHILDIVPIQDLILIMCDPSGDKALLVYLDEVPELAISEKEMHSISLKACVLEELSLDQIKYYYGFVAGYSALKILFTELPFHGVRFKDLDDILLEREYTIRIRERQKEAFAAMHKLALRLYTTWESWPEVKRAPIQTKVFAEVIKLAAPNLVYDEDLRGSLLLFR